MHLHLPPLLEGLFSIAVFLGVVIIACQKAFKNSTDKALDVSTGGI